MQTQETLQTCAKLRILRRMKIVSITMLSDISLSKVWLMTTHCDWIHWKQRSNLFIKIQIVIFSPGNSTCQYVSWLYGECDLSGNGTCQSLPPFQSIPHASGSPDHVISAINKEMEHAKAIPHATLSPGCTARGTIRQWNMPIFYHLFQTIPHDSGSDDHAITATKTKKKWNMPRQFNMPPGHLAVRPEGQSGNGTCQFLPPASGNSTCCHVSWLHVCPA